jgi:hypothetical protein
MNACYVFYEIIITSQTAEYCDIGVSFLVTVLR